MTSSRLFFKKQINFKSISIRSKGLQTKKSDELSPIERNISKTAITHTCMYMYAVWHGHKLALKHLKKKYSNFIDYDSYFKLN